MKKLYRIWFLTAILVFSLCLLTACGGSDTDEKAGSGAPSAAADAGDTLDPLDIAGTAWEVDGIVYHFFEDGIGSTDNGYIFSYTWDGSSGVVTAEDESVSLEIIYDEDGFFMEGEDELYYELTYAGEADTDLLADGENSGGDIIDLAGTAWEMVDGELQLHFFTDGDVATNDGGVISYTWDGSYGEISEGSTALGMIYDEDGFFVEMNDGIYHEFTYIGEADISLLMEDDGGYDDGREELAGTYDNDDEEMSICFNSDGTCTISTTSFEFDGYYEVDSNGNLYIDTGDELLGGYYDSSDDTFSLDGMSGWFYYTGSAGYAL